MLVANAPGSPAKGSYRKAALSHYQRHLDELGFNLCVVCGFGVQAVLEVAHLDQNRENNAVDNLAVLCPNCHKMHDIGLIPSEVVLALRDNPASVNWKLRIKDAGTKAAAARKAKALAVEKSAIAKKAWATRQKNKSL